MSRYQDGPAGPNNEYGGLVIGRPDNKTPVYDDELRCICFILISAILICLDISIKWREFTKSPFLRGVDRHGETGTCGELQFCKETSLKRR